MGKDLIKRLLKNRTFVIGCVLFGIVLAMAIFAPWISPHAPDRNNFRYRLGEPNWIYWMGTDGYGRDILSRVFYGCQLSLRISQA